MFPLTLPFPDIDPVAIEIGPIMIRWYALAYITGLVLGWLYMRWLARRKPVVMNAEAVDDFLFWTALGVVLGGRLGYVVFYNLGYFLNHPAEILYVWRGGMSFHGGLVGVGVAIVLFARRRGIAILALADMVCMAVTIGLFFGRIANFINGELFGRPADVPWAMVFPAGGNVPRHPSQLYEAGLEGLLLFSILFVLERTTSMREGYGRAAGLFGIGYGLSRFLVEYAREPDLHLGTLALGLTMGQWLSLPMILLGAFLFWFGARQR